MSPPRISWQEKVRQRIGYPKHGCVARLARQLDMPSRTVRNWLDNDVVPEDTAAILQSLARVLRVPRTWLEDGKPGAPPHIPESADAEWIAFVDSLPWTPRRKALAYALTDPDAVDWLADAYERLYLPTLSRAQSRSAR